MAMFLNYCQVFYFSLSFVGFALVMAMSCGNRKCSNSLSKDCLVQL